MIRPETRPESQTDYAIISKRFTVSIIELNEELAQKVPTFEIVSPVLELVPHGFNSPESFVLRLLYNIIYARINPQHSPYNLINIIAEYLLDQCEPLPERPEFIPVKLFLTNERKELENYIQNSREPQSADVLMYIQQNQPIFYKEGPFQYLIQTMQNKADPKISENLSPDKTNEYLFYLLICLRQREEYVFETTEHKFASILNQTLQFLQQDTGLDEFFMKLYQEFESPVEKLVLLSVLDIAVRVREITNFSLYLRCLTEVSSHESSQQMLDCIYILRNIPYILRSTAPDQLQQLEHFTFQCLLQSEKILQRAEAQLVGFCGSEKELETMLFTKLAQTYEQQQQFEISAYYYKKAGIEENTIIIKQEILSKIIEIIGFDGGDNSEITQGIEELERIIDAESSEGIREELILGKDVARLYRIFENGSKEGNTGIMRLARIILEECGYQDLKQGIMRDLIRFGVLGRQEHVAQKFCRNSVMAGDTIQQAKAILKQSKYAEEKLGDDDLNVFFEAAADSLVNWRLEENEDDLVVDWMIIQREVE